MQAESTFNFSNESAANDIDSMYREPLAASRTGPLYNAFSYPTKISPEVIGLFIATHTAPGQTVLDTFAGSGTTGIAALLCDRPTPQMHAMASRLKLQPRWGPRHAHLVDVGALGCFVAGIMTSPPNPNEFRDAAARLVKLAKARLSGLYDVTDPEGNPGEIRHVVWSEVLTCPNCGIEHRIWDVATQRQPAAFLKAFTCHACRTEHRVANCERVEANSVDIFGKVSRSRLRVPVEVHGVTSGHKWRRPALDSDQFEARWQEFPLPASAPRATIEWGELHRTGYHSGVAELHHFYTPRNFLALATCLEIASDQAEPMAAALRFLVLSYNASHSTLMTRIVAKKGQPDFVLTGAQSGVLYISGLPVEKNVLRGIERKAKVISDAFALTYGSNSTVSVHHTTSEKLPLSNHSVDYVFTDPPFGDYIPYAELNQVNELWLNSTTDRAAETVVSKSGNKDADHYEASMTKVFAEISRVLAPTGKVTVVFHSAHVRIWQALTHAYESAGFAVSKASILEKIQASFKQVVSTISVKGDPLLLLEKGRASTSEKEDVSDIFKRVAREFRDGGLSDPRASFSKYVSGCLAAGTPMSMDAAAFIKRLMDENVMR